MKKIIKSKEDTKEVKSKYSELEEKRATVRKIRERFHSYIRKCNATIEEGRVLSESMQEYATSLLSNNKSSVLGKCLFEVSQYQKFMEDATTDLCSYSLKNLDGQLETFIARETDNAQSIKKRYDKSRASLDSLQKSEVEDSEQHSRVVEIADEAIEQLKQVDNALDLHTLGFASRYLQAIHVSSLSLSHRSAHSLLVLQSFSSSLFEDEVDQYEVETGRPFSTFSSVFSPPWATDNDSKKALSSSVAVSLFDARKRDISDLLKKERVYVDTLKSLVKIYLFEFRNNRQVTKVVSLQDLEDLFSNIEEILDIHQDFTWDLQSALDPPFHTSLASLLLQFVPKLEPYVKYIANSSKSADTLSRLLKDKRCVTSAIKHCSEKDSSGKTFVDLLQMPLAHIKQYKIFVEQILNKTPTSSDDYDPLDDSLSLLFLLDAKISIAHSIASQYQVLVAMSKRVEGGEELVTSNPSRKFIKESPASTLESDVTLLLFIISNNGFIVKRRVGLSNVINAVVAGGSTVQIEISQEPPLAFSLPSYFEAQKWVDDLKDALQNLFTTKVFGVPLVELMSKHDREKENDIPSFIAEALDTIDATGIEMEGIFRVSGSVLTIRGIKDAINQGIPVDYRSLDIHSVAGMVQTWIRELPEPLLTYSLYTEWIGHTAKGLESGPLRATVAKLPHSHRFMLQHLCQFLNRVASFGKVNKMRSGNLAIVFGPSLLCERNSTASGEQPVQLEKDGPLVQVLSFASVHLRDVYQVVQFLIENYKEVFEGVEEEREKYRAKIRMEKITNQQSGGANRTEERKAIKERRMNEERAKAEIAAASDPEAVKRAEEKRQAKREERERMMKEEKERQEQERKRQEEEEKAQIELVKKQRAEAEEQKRLERQKKDIEDIEKKFAESQAIMQQEEERAREQRRQRNQDEKDRQAKEEEEFKARETARAQERKERERQEAIAKAEEEEQQRKQKEREEEEARKKEDALPSCTVCGKKVKDGVVSKERGVAWHKECYKCVECNSSINGGVSVNSNNTLVCANCVQKKKGTASGDGCPSCGKPLTGRVVKVGDKRIHKACFKCDQCSGSLDDGYYEVKGKIVCENCAK